MIDLERWQAAGIDLPPGTSGELRMTCPKCTPHRKPHNQRRKDLSIDVDQGLYHCFHCGWAGSVAHGERSAPMPGERLREREQLPAKREAWQAPRPLPSVTIPTLWQKTVVWFEKRGIPEYVMIEKGITASSEFCPVCGEEVGNVLFPFYVAGAHINTKHRCGKKHFRMEKGAQRVLYNLDAIAGFDTAVIVEGEMDALSVHTAGIANVVSVPDGAPAPDATNYSSKFSFLEAAEDALAHVKRFIIATDADAPGQKLMDELARRLGPERCSRVMWDEGIKDANDCLVQAGADYLRAMIEDAEPFPVEGIISANDVARELDDLYDNGLDHGLEIDPAYHVLNQHYRVKPGYMSIVTGIPSHGKSGVVDNILANIAKNHGWTFTIFSPEQQPAHKHFQHLIEIHTGKPMLDGPTPRMSRAEMHAAREWVSDHFSILTPDDPSIENILSLAKIEVFRRGIKGIVVDPWNELEHMRPRHMSETEYISSALSQFRRFAIAHQVHVWIVAHPTKLRRTEEGAEPIPTLYDIAGSANFRNKADIGMTVWRDIGLDDPRVQVHITKVRYQDQGQLGAVQFGYDAPSKCIYEIGKVEA
jgi:twinkle protein